MFNKKEKVFLIIMFVVCLMLLVQNIMLFKLIREVDRIDTIGWQPDIFNSNKKIIEKIDEVNSNLNDIYFKLD